MSPGRLRRAGPGDLTNRENRFASPQDHLFQALGLPAKPDPGWHSVGKGFFGFFRRVGATAYGYGLFSDRISFTDFAAMLHGDNERVDQESLRLSEELWEGTARDLLA